jgi:hypothetical protein
MGVGTNNRQLTGAFYEGGADQAVFDDIVLATRRSLGIMPDRGANGTCRPADIADYEPRVLGADIDFAHVGEGADDLLGLDFVSPPSDPLYTAAFEALSGTYESELINGALTAAGLAVHIPVSAASPTIMLPGWNEGTVSNPDFAPNSTLEALDGTDIVISWQADEIGGDLIHVWGVGNDAESEAFAFECFVEAEDQLITIPSATITALFPTMIDPLSMTTFVNSGSHTTVEYQGMTLDGFNIFRYGREEATADPNNPDG